MKYTLTHGIAALIHVESEAFPERYGRRSVAYIYNKPGDIQAGVADPIQFEELPWPVRKAIQTRFAEVFAIPIGERGDYLKGLKPIVIDVAIWSVVEQCGYEGERIISTWDTFDDAYCAVKEQYTPEEEMELHVSILRDGSSEY